MMLYRFDQLRNCPLFTHFTHSAALLQAVLQANTEPFRNGLIETRKRAVEMRTVLGTLLGPVEFLLK